MKKVIPLTDLKLNTTAHIYNISAASNIKRRLLDLGIITNTPITPVFRSTSGDPIAYEIRGIVLALRHEDAKNIFVY